MPPTALRHVAADERKRIAEQLATSRGQPRPAVPSLGSAAEQAAVEEVRDQIMALQLDMKGYIETCQPLAPAIHQFKTDLVLLSDPDIGTLVDSNTPVLTQDDRPVPQAFSDCLRGEFQTLELPPLKTGDTYRVSFEFETSDRPRD